MTETRETIQTITNIDDAIVRQQTFTETFKRLVTEQGWSQADVDDLAHKLTLKITEKDAEQMKKAIDFIAQQPGWTAVVIGLSGLGLRDDENGRLSSVSTAGPNGGHTTASLIGAFEELACKVGREIRSDSELAKLPQGVLMAKTHIALANSLEAAMERIFPEAPKGIFQLSPVGLDDPNKLLEILKGLRRKHDPAATSSEEPTQDQM